MFSSCRKSFVFVFGGFINRFFVELDLCWYEFICGLVIDFFFFILRIGGEVWYMISIVDRFVIWRKVI